MFKSLLFQCLLVNSFDKSTIFTLLQFLYYCKNDSQNSFHIVYGMKYVKIEFLSSNSQKVIKKEKNIKTLDSLEKNQNFIKI